MRDRTVPIFTGDVRFDIQFYHKGTADFRGSKKGYNGSAEVCGLIYKPVAGHRIGSGSVKFHSGHQENEIWFARVADEVDLMIPVFLRLKFKPGKVTVALDKVAIN